MGSLFDLGGRNSVPFFFFLASLSRRYLWVNQVRRFTEGAGPEHGVLFRGLGALHRIQPALREEL